MYISNVKPEDIQPYRQGMVKPEGAVFLSREEVQKLQFIKMKRWENKMEIWPLVYGAHIAAAATILGAATLSKQYRKLLRVPIGHHQFATLMPVMLVPGATCIMYHLMNVQPRILAKDHTSCTVCLTTRVGAWQAFFGGVQSQVSAMTMCTFFADKSLWPNWFDIKSIGRFLVNTSPSRKIIVPLYFAHFVLGSFLCEESLRNFEEVFMKPNEVKLNEVKESEDNF